MTAHVVQLDTRLPAGREYRILDLKIIMYYSYVLKSSRNGKFYYGHTQNLEKRLKEHNSGKTKSTKPNVPYEIVFYEVCKTREEAILREKYFKSGSGREYVKTKLKSTRSSIG